MFVFVPLRGISLYIQKEVIDREKEIKEVFVPLRGISLYIVPNSSTDPKETFNPVFVPLRGISLYINEIDNISKRWELVKFSSPYEELVYILIDTKAGKRNQLFVFVPLRGISLYIMINTETTDSKEFKFSSPYEELVYIYILIRGN